jgi:peptidoglycan/LPS O-acetylase OafA/YrhL
MQEPERPKRSLLARPLIYLRSLSTDERRLWLTVGAFGVGVTVGIAERVYLGYINIADFSQGAAPLVAGLLIGVVFEGSRIADRRVQAGGGMLVYQQRRLSSFYVLAGSLFTALGALPANGWFFGFCFLVLCGSLAASCYVVMDMVAEHADVGGNASVSS